MKWWWTLWNSRPNVSNSLYYLWLFFRNRRVVFWKRHVVLWKVTRRFMKSDPSFSEKWPVVLGLSTCTFSRIILKSQLTKRRLKSSIGKWCLELCENICNHLLSRERICAYVQEFLCFCCHKCHRCICKCLKYSGIWLVFRLVLIFRYFYPHKIDGRTGKTRFLLPLSSKKSSFLLSFFTSGVILVTAKNQHRCWKARVTRTRVSILPSPFISFSALRGW